MHEGATYLSESLNSIYRYHLFVAVFLNLGLISWYRFDVEHLALRQGLWMRSLYERVPSPLVGVWLFWRPALVVQSPLLARRVLIKDADNFRDRFLSSGSSDPIGALNLFTVNVSNQPKK